MRDYRLRCWDEKTKTMFLVSTIDLSNQHNDGRPIMQFTGLHDKNGKGIFEGDLVKLKSYNFYYLSNQTFKVVYFPENMMYKFVSIEDGKTYDKYGLHSIEVIGNIYEN